ncbi:MAG: hypothetical protein ACK2US_06660 [Anaerolineae bacterium]|jgi:hypothetical protein
MSLAGSGDVELLRNGKVLSATLLRGNNIVLAAVAKVKSFAGVRALLHLRQTVSGCFDCPSLTGSRDGRAVLAQGAREAARQLEYHPDQMRRLPRKEPSSESSSEVRMIDPAEVERAKSL